MRRRLVELWPALSSEFGIMPWDVDRLTVDELRCYVEWYNDKYGEG